MAKRPWTANYNGASKWTTPPSDDQYKANYDAIFKKNPKTCDDKYGPKKKEDK